MELIRTAMLGRPYRITKSILKQDAPDWEWKAIKNGFGWKYKGIKGSQTVEVRRYAVLRGFLEDDYATEWRVISQGVGMDYVSWLLKVI